MAPSQANVAPIVATVAFQLANSVRGDALLAPSITRRLIDRYVAQPLHTAAADIGLDELTSREREAVALVAQGLTNDQIAGRM